jgi:hypothetical protein
MENGICPICINDIDEEYITECDHKFCIYCIHLCDQKNKDLKCPLCRKPIVFTYTGKKIPFNKNNYPVNPNIKGDILLRAYNVISRLDKWKILYDYKVDENCGFMFSEDKEIQEIMNELGQDDSHSGCSLAYTMRELHYIACYGINRYIKIKDM